MREVCLEYVLKSTDHFVIWNGPTPPTVRMGVQCVALGCLLSGHLMACQLETALRLLQRSGLNATSVCF